MTTTLIFKCVNVEMQDSIRKLVEQYMEASDIFEKLGKKMGTSNGK